MAKLTGDKSRPVRRKLAYAVCRVEWRGEVIEHELEVSDSAGGMVIQQLLVQAFKQANDDLAELIEAVARGDLDELDAADTPEPLPTVEQTVDILSLVNVHVTATQAAQWSGRKRLEAVRWASAVHLDASDNDVEIPPKPGFLATEQRRPDDPALLRQAGRLVPRGAAFTLDMSKVPGTPERPWADGSPSDTELSDLPARGGQCRAIVVRQKEHAEVREPCGYQLGTIGEWTSCPNYNNHLDAATMVGEDEGTLEPRPVTLKDRLTEAYEDRFASSPPENATIDWLQERLQVAGDHPANPTGNEFDPDERDRLADMYTRRFGSEPSADATVDSLRDALEE